MRGVFVTCAAAGALLLVTACGERRATTERPGGEDTVAAVLPDTSAGTQAVQDSTPAPPGPGTSVARQTPPAGDTTRAGTRDTATRKATAAKPDTVKKPPATSPKPNVDPRPAEPKPGQVSVPKPADTAAAPLRDPYHKPPRDTVSQVTYDGWKQYNLNCARCHGEDVLGTTIAPHLIVSVKPDGPINTKELFMQVVCQGRPEKGMPAWCPLGLEMTKIEAIYSYVKGRSDGKIGPGRPAVRSEG